MFLSPHPFVCSLYCECQLQKTTKPDAGMTSSCITLIPHFVTTDKLIQKSKGRGHLSLSLLYDYKHRDLCTYTRRTWMYHNNFLNDSGLETHKQVFVALKYRFNFSLNMEYDGTFSKGVQEFGSATWCWVILEFDLYLQQFYTISLTFRISFSLSGEHACTKYKHSLISRLLLFKYILSEIHYILYQLLVLITTKRTNFHVVLIVLIGLDFWYLKKKQ